MKTLDAEKSKEVYEYCKPYIEAKSCYNNIFNVVTDYIAAFRSNEWRVAYGYVEAMEHLYCRHCFVIDENDNVIDPTIYTQTEPPLQRNYYIMTVFDDVDEYLTAIEKDDGMPALYKHLREQDNQARLRALDNGLIFV